jgi:hypothetical protein
MHDMANAAGRLLRASMIAAIANVGLVACEPSTNVPADAQLVRIRATSGDVRIQPSRAGAGDIYLVLEEPTESIVFVTRKPTAEATPGPLSDEDLARLAHGDAQGTSIEGFETTGCDASHRAADRGKLKVPGGCGNVFRVRLAPGKYAILAEDPAAHPGGSTPMAVLDVLP